MAGKDRKALGTGLSALFGDISSPDEEMTFLPLSRIEPREEQPRNVFDEEALQTLADSISRYGVLQPITVRLLDSGYYQIIAGERRWRASRMAGLTEVPVRIIEADDRTTAELALVENLQREDLNPIEEAKGYKTLIEDYGLTQEDAAKSVGKSRPAISNALRLLNLSPDVLHLVETGELSAGHARALLSIQNEEIQLQAAKEIMAKALSVRKAEVLASKALKKNSESEESRQKSDPTEIDYAKEISTLLTKKLGRKVTLTEGRNSGKIELEFYDADDREMLISQLSSIK
ncbi:MAG: ParB/RepB/Spo0J family partition protein [Oscillospiraceae bacterium]|nr:ParB/RepB/Spo0J family partition protein [Oscillospiraceae bacterium]